MLHFSLLFALVFGWKVGAIADLITAVSLLLVVHWFVVKGRGVPLGLAPIFIAIAIASAYSSVVVAASGALDPQVALRSLRALIAFLGGLALVGSYWDRWGGDALKMVVLHAYFAVGLHAIVIVAMYLNDDLRLAVYEHLGTFKIVNVNASILLGLRIPGLTYGLASTSIVQLCGLLLLPAVLRMNRQRRVVMLVVLLLVPLLIASLFLTGRSGLLLGVIFLPLVIAGGLLLANGEARMLPIVGIGLVIAGVWLTTGDVVSSILPEKFAYNLERASELLLLLDDPGRSPTMVILRDMYFLPKGDLALFFGSGNLGRGAMGYIPSDVGFVLLVFAIGILGAFLVTLPFALSLVAAWSLRHHDAYLALAVVTVLVLTIVFNAKELALLTRNMWSLQVILISAAVMATGRHSRNGQPARTGVLG